MMLQWPRSKSNVQPVPRRATLHLLQNMRAAHTSKTNSLFTASSESHDGPLLHACCAMGELVDK